MQYVPNGWKFSTFEMNKTYLSHPACSFLDINLEQTKGTFIASVLTVILNSVFSLITATGNFIILEVIWKAQELHSSSFILLFCLAVSDFPVGLICQPSFVAYQIAELVDSFSVYCTLQPYHNLSFALVSHIYGSGSAPPYRKVEGKYDVQLCRQRIDLLF